MSQKRKVNPPPCDRKNTPVMSSEKAPPLRSASTAPTSTAPTLASVSIRPVQSESSTDDMALNRVSRKSFKSHGFVRCRSSPDKLGKPVKRASRYVSSSILTMNGDSMVNLQIPDDEKHNKTDEQQEWLLGVVAENKLFLKLSQEQCTLIVEHMGLEEIPTGSDLITQGGSEKDSESEISSDKFYVVESGEFDIYVDDKLVNTCPKGSCIGELGIVNSGPRTATCKANQESSVWAVEREIIDKIIGKNVAEQEGKFRKSMRKIRRRHNSSRRAQKKTEEEIEWISGLITKRKVFEKLTSNQIRTIIKQMFKLSIKQGDILVQQGEIDTSFYVIASGSFDIIVDDRVVNSMGKGLCFGELAVRDTGPRTATCKAAEDCVIYKLDRMAWRKLRLDPTQVRKSLGSPRKSNDGSFAGTPTSLRGSSTTSIGESSGFLDRESVMGAHRRREKKIRKRIQLAPERGQVAGSFFVGG